MGEKNEDGAHDDVGPLRLRTVLVLWLIGLVDLARGHWIGM